MSAASASVAEPVPFELAVLDPLLLDPLVLEPAVLEPVLLDVESVADFESSAVPDDSTLPDVSPPEGWAGASVSSATVVVGAAASEAVVAASEAVVAASEAVTVESVWAATSVAMSTLTVFGGTGVMALMMSD